MASTLEWFKKIAERLVRQEEKSTHREPNLFPRVYDSRLEDRRVLNAGAVVSAVDLLALRFDAGQSANDGSTDKFELVRLESSNGANQIAVTINDQRVWQGRSTELHSVRFDGSNDADQFFIDPTIQFHDGIYVNGTGVSTGPQSLGSSDLVVFATTSHLRFDEIIYQTSDQLTQVRFASPSQHLNSLVQVQNVETIRDLSLATDRTIAIGSPNNSYVLQNEQPMSERPALQFSNQKNRLEFTVPSNRLTIDTLAATANRNSIMIDTVNLEGLDQLKIAGSDSDIVRQKGHLTIGRSLTIEAGTIDIDGSIATGPEGEVRLDAGPGILSVNGVISSRGDDLHRGGSVVLTGDRVSLQEGTRIDVSGGTGGGQIRVGGGYQGKDSSLRNSHHTYVAATASLNADARINGNGGTVIVWSDDTAIIDGSGNIFARGGSTAGDGGFIETSGKKFLKVDGSANAFAFNGKSGTWLLDPNNIEIVTVAGATPLTSYVLISTIESGLATGNVSIITNTGGAGDGDITIVDALTLAPVSRTLTLNATRDIKFLSGLTGNSNLQVSLVAGRDVDTSAVAIGQLGALTITAARNIILGSVNLSGGTFAATIDSNNNNSNATFQSTGALSAGSISIAGSTTVNDDVTLSSTVTSTTGAIQFSNIDDLAFQADVSAATNITFTSVTGPLSLGSNVDVTANNGPINFSSVTSGIQLAGSNASINILAANGATGSLTLGSVSATNPTVSLTLSSSTNTTVGSIDIQDGNLEVTIDSDNNDSNAAFQSTGALSAGSISIAGSTTVNDDVTLGSTVTATTGAIQFLNIDDLAFQGDVTAATSVTSTSVTGSLSLGSNVDVTANNGPINFSSITSGIQLAGSNGSTNILTANGATGSLTLGSVSATNPTVSLTLSSSTNTSVGSIDIQNGSLAVTIDSDNNNSGATFQSTGALSAGSISIAGSTTVNDDVTLGSTVTSTTGAIQYSQVDDLSFQGDVTAATNITFTSVTGPLSLGSNVDVTANNGPINFSSITAGIQLAGSNGSTNILTTKGATGSLTLGSVSATNPTVSLTLSSSTNTSVGSIDIQDGSLGVTIDSDNNNSNATFQSTGALSAGSISIAGSTTVNDDVTLSSTVTATTGAIQFSQVDDLSFQGDVTAATSVTSTSVTGPLSLGSNVDVTANNGLINFSSIASGIQLAGSNGSTNILTAKGATGSLTLGSVSATNATVSLTLSSSTNTSVGSIDIQNGSLAVTIDSDNNNSNATFQSTGALSAGTISIAGSTTVNDDVTLGSTVTSTTGAIQFSQVEDLSFQGDVTAATNITFTSVTGPLSLGSNVDVTANNGPINFSSITSGIQLAGSNGSTNIIKANGATGSLTLGNVSATNSTISLTLSSSTNTSVGSIDIQNGSLAVTIDSNNNDAGATFQSTGALSAGTISIAGSTTVNDHVTIGSTATSTTGAIQFWNIDDLAFQGDVTAATNVTFTNVTGPLVLGSNVDVTANNGSLDFSSISAGVLLGGVTGSTNVMEAKGNTSQVSLAPVTTTNASVRLNVRSDYSADLQSIDMQNGTLDVIIGRSTTRTDASVLLRHVTAGRLSVAGTSQLNDTAVLNDTLAIGANGVTLQKFSVLDVNANVQSVGDVVVTNIGDRIRIAGSVRVESNAGIDLQGNVQQIQLIGADGSENHFQANGEASVFKLAELSSLQNVNLVLRSADSVHLLGVDTKNGMLTIDVDGNINAVGSRLDSNFLRAGQIAITGSLAKDDLAVINGSMEARTGNIVIDSFGSVSWNGDVTASSSIRVTNLSNRLNIGSGRMVRSLNGDVDLTTNLNQVNFIGGSGTTTTIAATNGSLRIAAMTENIASSLIELRADRDVLLKSSLMASNLRVVAGDHNGPSGSINTVSTLAASSIRLEAATGIGTTSALATAASSIDATNRFSGAVQIANSLAGPVLVSNLVSNLGGNIDFRQSGGGLVRFQRVNSNPDTSPAANEATIRLRNDGGGLIIEGTGVLSGGLGGVDLETISAGDIQLDANTQALNGGVSINSARRIVGNGPIQGLSINLNAGTGIGTSAPLQAHSTQLSAVTGSGTINVTNASSVRANVSELRSNALGSILFRQVGGGDVAFSSVSTGLAISNADSNIRLFNDNGSIFVERASPIAGGIVAGGGGSILFTAQDNLVLESGAIIETQGATATIRGNAGGRVQFIPGATIRAGSSNPTTEAVVTRIPPLVWAQTVVNFDGVNVDSEGVASILVQLGGPNPILVDRNFSVVIDWGDNQVDHFPNGLISSGTTNPQIARFDASGVNYQITHKYLGNPNPSDPVADIPVSVKVGVDSLNRIQFSDSQNVASSQFQVVNEKLVVPAAGLFSLSFVIPQTPSVQTRLVFNNASQAENATASSLTVKSAEFEVSSSNSSVEQKRTYVLRVITPINEEGGVDTSKDIPLAETDIDDLSGLFRRLGDDRYRIYLIREDGSQMMLKDFYLRNHRPIEIDDAPASELLPAEERVLDESASVSTERPDTTMAGANEDASTQNNEEKALVTNSTMAIGASAPAMRSWRKAARRFRAS